MRFNLRGVPVVFTAHTIESGAPAVSVADRVESVEILLDRASIETFVNQGEISSTRFVLPNENGLSVKAEGGPIKILSLSVFPLSSAWEREAAR